MRKEQWTLTKQDCERGEFTQPEYCPLAKKLKAAGYGKLTVCIWDWYLLDTNRPHPLARLGHLFEGRIEPGFTHEAFRRVLETGEPFTFTIELPDVEVKRG